MANDKFYKTKAEKAKSRPRTWKGGEVAPNQTSPKKGSRAFAEASRLNDSHDFPGQLKYSDKGSDAFVRSGEASVYAARKDAEKAANRAGKKLSRTPRSGTAGLKPKATSKPKPIQMKTASKVKTNKKK